MDYSTDAMGNYMGDYAPVDPYAQETEEEKRLRLQREADEAARAQAAATPVKETRIIDPRTGEVKLKIEGNERDLSAANPNTPTVVKPGDYSAYTARQESGANPNIGYHYPANAQGQRKSSAYGTYGLTARAYKDIQAANPAFANRPLESLSPDEQTQANETYRGVLGQQLQAKGVEPTEENTRLAHLLGAQGAARYLQNRTVSSQAAAANGGPERLKQIAEARRLGQPAPASGAAVAQPQPAPAVPVQPQMAQPAPAPAAPVTPETPMAPGSAYSLAQGGGEPGITVPGMNVPLTEGTQLPMAQQRFQTNQDNVQELLTMRNDTSLPAHLRQRSADRAYELLQNERMKSAAEQKFQSMVAAGDNKGIANAVQGRGAKGEEGNFLKMIALGFISPELAGVEAEKLGLAPTKWEQTTISDENGNTKAVEVKKSVRGKILEATNMDGTPLTSDEMSSLNAMGGKKVHSAQTLIDPDTKQVVTQQVLSDGTMRYMAGGRVYTGNKDVLIPEAAYTAQEAKKTAAADKSASKKEEQQSKAEDRRVEAAIKALEKRIPNPTLQQRQQALVVAGVPAARIEQELGLAEGSLAGQVPAVPAAPVQQAPAAPPAAPVPPTAVATPPTVTKTETTIGQLPPRPIEPTPVEPGPGESAESTKARNKTAQDTYKNELAAWQKQKDRFDKREEELPTKQAATQDSLDLIDRFIKHPGFPDVVGVPGVTGILNIPLSDARAARQLYNQIDADTFLQGFERLRGGGSITEVEGAQAKQAVNALRDRYITEAEFKANAKIYTDILKRGINRERQQLGLTPLYPDVPESGTAGGNLTTAQKAAAEIERRKKGQ